MARLMKWRKISGGFSRVARISDSGSTRASVSATGYASLTYGANSSGIPMSCTGRSTPPTPGCACPSIWSSPAPIRLPGCP
jgi:hypothetical protein